MCFPESKTKKCTSKGYGIEQLIECGINYLTDDEQIKSGKLRQIKLTGKLDRVACRW